MYTSSVTSRFCLSIEGTGVHHLFLDRGKGIRTVGLAVPVDPDADFDGSALCYPSMLTLLLSLLGQSNRIASTPRCLTVFRRGKEYRGRR